MKLQNLQTNYNITTKNPNQKPNISLTQNSDSYNFKTKNSVNFGRLGGASLRLIELESEVKAAQRRLDNCDDFLELPKLKNNLVQAKQKLQEYIDWLEENKNRLWEEQKKSMLEIFNKKSKPQNDNSKIESLNNRRNLPPINYN